MRTQTNTINRCLLSSLLLGMLLISSSVNATDIILEGKGGLDSNPLELADRHDPDIELNILLNAYLRHRMDNGLMFKAVAQDITYPSLSEADSQYISLTPGYFSSFDFSGKSVDYKISIDIASFEYTYVSKSTGSTGEFNSQSIGDRFNSDYVSYNLQLSHKTSEKSLYTVWYQYRDKDYVDFTNLGLSNLDYSHNLLGFGIEVRTSGKSRIFSQLELVDRDYRDRRALDINGNEIAGSNLKYDFNDWLIGYRYQPNEKFRMELSYQVETREDNASGYWDTSKDEFILRFRYLATDAQSFEGEIRARDKQYDRADGSGSATEEEDARQTDSTRYRLNFTKSLDRNKDTELSYSLGLEVTDTKSSDPDYQYQRTMISAGVKWQMR